MQWATREERPDIAGISPSDVWPEYNLYGDVVGGLWSRLYDSVPQFQSVCVDEQTGQVLAVPAESLMRDRWSPLWLLERLRTYDSPVLKSSA